MSKASRRWPYMDAQWAMTARLCDLARWWCYLNDQEWPEDFPVPKPDGWDGMSPRMRSMHPTATGVWDVLVKVVPFDVALAYSEGPYRDRVRG